MYLKSIQIENYKSFYDSEVVTFTKGFNVIVGKNGAGKTALLEALRPQSIQKKYHRSPLTIPEVGYVYNPGSNNKRHFIMSFEAQDFRRIITGESFHLRTYAKRQDRNYGEKFQHMFNNGEELNLNVTFNHEASEGHPTFDIPMNFGEDEGSAHLSYLFDREENDISYAPTISTQLDASKLLFDEFCKSVYSFSAERPIKSQYPLDGNYILAPDASNLVRLIHRLYTWRYPVFMKYLEYVKQVFPEIHFLGVPDTSHGSSSSGGRTTFSADVTLQLWHSSIEDERYDLTVTLAETGKGYGQALAILYIVTTTETPQIILIDEPQTYLHPNAIRRLFSILRQFPQHQYIITTHSPIVINIANPDNLLLVRKENHRSVVERIEKEDRQQMHYAFRQTGISLSDVYGADSILWVEGPTEETCYPYLIGPELIVGTVIKSVLQTGDFKTKKTKNIQTILKLYEALTSEVGLLPPSFGFIFDGDWSHSDKERVLNETDRKGMNFVFTDYMQFESYLLHVESIAELLLIYTNRDDITADIVQDVLDGILYEQEGDSQIWNKKYFFNEIAPDELTFDEIARSKLLGADVFAELFTSIFGSEYEYNKVFYGEELTKLILKNNPHFLEPLRTFLNELIKSWGKQ